MFPLEVTGSVKELGECFKGTVGGSCQYWPWMLENHIKSYLRISRQSCEHSCLAGLIVSTAHMEEEKVKTDKAFLEKMVGKIILFYQLSRHTIKPFYFGYCGLGNAIDE